jgi:hypothetical protein
MLQILFCHYLFSSFEITHSMKKKDEVIADDAKALVIENRWKSRKK